MYKQPEYKKGFTLHELMVTVAITGILIGLAIPGFISMITSNQLTASANDLVTALNLARSEAIKRGIQVTVKNKETSTHWESGWDVFVDINGNETFGDNGNTSLCETGEDCLLRTYPNLPDGYTLTTGGSSYKNYAAYLPSGISNVVAGDTYRLCSGLDNTISRAIIINSMGRARVSTGTTACP